MRFFAAFIGRTMFSSSSAGISMTVTSSTNLTKALAMFFKEFSNRATTVLKVNGAGLCHEMAKYSLPTKANTALTANNALQVYAKENAALAGVAFKPWENRSPEFWFMSGYQSVSDYVMKRGNKWQSPIHQNLAMIGRYDILNKLLARKGFQVPADAPSKKYVVDKADLGDFIKWKSQYKKNPNRKNYYVKDKSSITRIAQEKSLYNYASIVINGWLKAAKGLGSTLPSGVQKVQWPHGANLGWGKGSVKRIDRYTTQMTIRNDYANLNGIFNSATQQTVWNRRINIMNQETKKMFVDMERYWSSLKV